MPTSNCDRVQGQIRGLGTIVRCSVRQRRQEVIGRNIDGIFCQHYTDDDVRVRTRQSHSAKSNPVASFALLFRFCLRVICERHAGSAKILSRNRENLIGGIEGGERNRRWVRTLGCDADPGDVNIGKGRVHVGYGAFDRIV
jgi:hypothetical protein